MGLADKIADIIRPRPAGLFSTPAPAPSPAVSSTSILSGAASNIAREGVRAFIRALERAREVAEQADEAARYLGLSPHGVPTYQLLGKLQSVVVKLTIPTDDAPPLSPPPRPVVSWGGVPLRGFEEGEFITSDASESAYDVEVTKEIDKRSQQVGRIAGLRLAAKGASRQEAYAYAKQLEAEMRAQLRARVDAGESLPSHDTLLKRAGFDDVAARGTPPPIVLSLPRVPISVTCRIEGGMPTPEEARAGKEIRDVIKKVFHEELDDELARGVRDAKLGIVY